MFCVCRTSLTLKKKGEYKFLSVHPKCIYIIISYNISCISILLPNFAPCIFPSLQPHSFRLHSGFWISGSTGWSHLFETSMWSIAGRISSGELSNDRWQTTTVKPQFFFGGSGFFHDSSCFWVDWGWLGVELLFQELFRVVKWIKIELEDQTCSLYATLSSESSFTMLLKTQNDFNHISIMQPKEKGIVYDFAKLCLNIRTSEDLATHEMFIFHHENPHAACFGTQARQMSCRGSQESVVFFWGARPASKWYPKIPDTKSQSLKIPKPKQVLRIFRIFVCSMKSYSVFSLLRCLAGCSTSLSRLSPWWATRNVARTWSSHDKWVGMDAMIPEAWMTSWLVKGGGYPKMWWSL